MEPTSASRASRHLGCHASANLELAIPNWTPPEEDQTADNAANRGSAMHLLFAETMQLKAADLENYARALAYVAAVRRTRRFKTLIEHEVKVMWLQGKPSTTADLVLYTSDELHILDLKTGKIPVSAVENNQLMFYAVTYGSLAPKAKGVHLHIVQPWADVMNHWYADVNRLAQFKQEVQEAELKIRQGSTVFTPGDHCLFCPAYPHSRTAKGAPLCPVTMQLLYPRTDVDEDALKELME